jgi:hypothetical protein
MKSAIAITFLCIGSMILPQCQNTQKMFHNYIMKGSIVAKKGSDVIICIGKKDGAKAGQELDVFRFVQGRSLSETGEEWGVGPDTASAYRRVKTGRIRITRVFDEHFARARILSGTARVNYAVELVN